MTEPPWVDDGRPRICPVCFESVKLVKRSTDRWGWYERWECQRPDAKEEIEHRRRAPKERGHKPGVFILRAEDYEKAWRKRGRVQAQREKA